MESTTKEATHSAREAAMAMAQIANLKKTNEKIDAETAQHRMQTALTETQLPIAAAQVENMQSSAAQARAQTVAIGYHVHEVVARTKHYGSLDKQVQAATRQIELKTSLLPEEKQLAFELARAQIIENHARSDEHRASARLSDRRADNPYHDAGIFGQIGNTSYGVLRGIDETIAKYRGDAKIGFRATRDAFNRGSDNVREFFRGGRPLRSK
jgi:hypothetical protein